MTELKISQPSGTDRVGTYLVENFQLTHSEAVHGTRYVDVPPPQFVVPPADINVELVMVDGELYLLDRGSPPELDPLPSSAGILRARD